MLSRILQYILGTRLLGTKIGAVGTIGLGVHQLSQGQIETGLATIALGWAVLMGTDAAVKADEKIEQVMRQAGLPATDSPTVPPPVNPNPTILALVALCIFAGSASAEDAKVKVALALASAKANSANESAMPKPIAQSSMASDYSLARSKAVSLGVPLLVFVNQPKRDIPGTVSVQVEQFGDINKGVVVGMNRDGDLVRWSDLPGTPANAAIIRSMASGLCQDGSCVNPAMAPLGGWYLNQNFCPTCPR